MPTDIFTEEGSGPTPQSHIVPQHDTNGLRSDEEQDLFAGTFGVDVGWCRELLLYSYSHGL